MKRPRILDLFCGAGGAAMGYHRAGFMVTGVDLKDQPNYPFDFFQHDAMSFLRNVVPNLYDFDAIHASPPCQAHSVATKRWEGAEHADLIPETRELLEAIGLPWVIENVEGAPLRAPIRLCGSSFSLNVRRHRLFEASFPLAGRECDHGWQTPRFRVPDKRRKSLSCVVPVYGHTNYDGDVELRRQAMGIPWMTAAELSQAIPPAYTEFIGKQLIEHVS